MGGTCSEQSCESVSNVSDDLGSEGARAKPQHGQWTLYIATPTVTGNVQHTADCSILVLAGPQTTLTSGWMNGNLHRGAAARFVMKTKRS